MPLAGSTDLPSSSPSESDRTRLRWFIHACVIGAAATVLLAGILHVEPLLSANDRSRWATVVSLVERGTYQIDEIDRNPAWTTIDKVRHEGHFYSSKPPLLATLVAGVYWGVKQITGGNLLDQTAATARLVLIVVNLLPVVVALVLLAALVERYARTEAARVFVVVAASFATFLTTFVVTLNNHTVAAVCVVFALYPALRILVDGRRSPWLFAGCGFFAAFTSTNELPAALFGLAMFGLLLRKAPRRTLIWFIPAALVPLAAYFWTNWLATGGWKPFYLYYGTEKYEYVFEGVPSYWMNPQGLDRATDSPLAYFLHCTIGHHGIFSLSPIFLLTAATWISQVCDRLRRRDAGGRLPVVHWLGLLLTVVVLGFYLTRTQNYNYGGNTAGLRWMFWLIPFWLVGMIPTLDRWGHQTSFRALAIALLILSTFSAVYPLNNPWRHPWLFTAMQRLGWVSDRSEPPPRFERPVTTWFPSLPDPAAFGERAWVELSGPDGLGGTAVVRLTDAGDREIDGRMVRQVDLLTRSGLAADGERQSFYIDVVRFAAGVDPGEFLVWPDGPPAVAERMAAEAFLRALPRERPYREGSLRYLKTGLRRDAFECQRAAARVPHRLSERDEVFWYRTDLWLCSEVPFGVARIETRITDSETGAVVGLRRLTVRAVSGLRAKPARLDRRP